MSRVRPFVPATSSLASALVRRIRWSVAPIALATTALVAACGDNAQPRGSAKDKVFAPASPEISDVAVVPQDMASRAVESKIAAPRPGSANPFEIPATPSEVNAPASTSMIIRTGFASVEVDSLELAIAAVQGIATSLGGWVGNTSLSAGENAVRSASIELKVPAARYDEALAGLRPIGRVETVSSNAEDVGEEFVDLSARTANSRRLEERLVTLLATRTGKLEDVLNVERELARVREEVERYEGRLRYLRGRVATSTLTVTVHERAPLVSNTPGENVIVEAFRDSWRNFVRFVAAFIASLGTIVPILVLAGALALAWRRFRPRRQPSTLPPGQAE